MRCECGGELREHFKFCKICGRPVSTKEEKRRESPPATRPTEEPVKEAPSEKQPPDKEPPEKAGREPFGEGAKRHLFFVLDSEQEYVFNFRKHLETFRSVMPPMIDEYYVRTDLADIEKGKPYGKTELLGHERIFAYQKKWGAQEYLLRILYNLIHGKFAYYGTKTIKMKKPSVDVVKKIPLLFSDERLTELPLQAFHFGLGFEGKAYFTGRRFLIMAENVLGDASQQEKNSLKAFLSFWIKPDFETLFTTLDISGFLLNLIPPTTDDERFTEIHSASEGMWKKPISEWEKASTTLAERLEFSVFILKGKSFENPGLGKLGAFINPLFLGKKRIPLRSPFFFLYPKKEEQWSLLLEECALKARPTDVCDLVAMQDYAREMDLKRAASHIGYPVPLEKFRHEV